MTDISAAEREAYQSVAYPTAIVSHMTPDRIRAGGDAEMAGEAGIAAAVDDDEL